MVWQADRKLLPLTRVYGQRRSLHSRISVITKRSSTIELRQPPAKYAHALSWSRLYWRHTGRRHDFESCAYRT